jgi:hypothetical protein
MIIPPTPYCAENEESETCTSARSSNTAGFAFWLAGRVEVAPSARTLLKGKLPLEDAVWPGLADP